MRIENGVAAVKVIVTLCHMYKNNLLPSILSLQSRTGKG